ncbi:hypothetical protein T484DRAFT_1766057 [Baffinella frigidus]|nr:hypothetical protein T484DRAFT_1766057 [Cryptophyta sp. CCMP2293]
MGSMEADVNVDSALPLEEVPATSKVFDLEKQKHAALQSLPARGRESPAFKQFFKSQLADDYLCAALDHFAALLRVEDMMQTRIAGKKPQDIPPPSQEEKQAADLLQDTIKEVSAYYCYTIMQFSRYNASQQVGEVSAYCCYTIMQFSRYNASRQDRMFFESLYEFITGVVCAAFPDRMFFESLYEFITGVVCAAFPVHHKGRVEDEMARILRTDTFNLSARKNDSNHHTKMFFTSRELYTLRYAGDGYMGKRILAALHPRIGRQLAG